MQPGINRLVSGKDIDMHHGGEEGCPGMTTHTDNMAMAPKSQYEP